MDKCTTSLLNVDLNLLLHLRALLEERNVSLAAKKNHITQAAMSNALKRLRKLFNNELLVRVGNKTLLTPKAEHISIHLQEPLLNLENIIIQHQKFDPAEENIQFKIGFHGYEETVILPLLCEKLIMYPNILIRSVGPEGQNLPQDLIDGKLQLVTSPFLIDAPGIKRIKLISDYFVCLTHNTKKIISCLEDYIQAQHLLIAPYGEPKGMIDEILEREKIKRMVRVTISEFNSAPLLLSHHKTLVTSVPKRLADMWCPFFPLQQFDHPLAKTTFTIYLYWHSRWDHDLRSAWIRSQILNIFK